MAIKTGDDLTIFELATGINDLNVLFELQGRIAEEIEKDTKNSIEIVEDVIQAINSLPHNIPSILDLITYIFELVKQDKETTLKILNKFSSFVTNRKKEQLRCVAIDVLCKYDPSQIVYALVIIACDETDSPFVRQKALQSLKDINTRIFNLHCLLEILERNEEEFMILVMDVLENQQQFADSIQAQFILEKVSRREETSLPVRCRAIELLGVLGDINIVERICLLSGKEPQVLESLKKMLQSILSKPLNIHGIRAENFEQLIKELILKLGYQQVTVTRAVRDDGVDVVAFMDGHKVRNKPYKVIIQCKRYTDATVDVETVEQLLEDMKKHKAKEGHLITTSKFSPKAKVFAQNNQYIELIDGENLQLKLDEAFGKGYYSITSRDLK